MDLAGSGFICGFQRCKVVCPFRVTEKSGSETDTRSAARAVVTGTSNTKMRAIKMLKTRLIHIAILSKADFDSAAIYTHAAGSLFQHLPAGAGQLVQRAARQHLAEHLHGLNAPHIGPLPLWDRIEPQHLARPLAGLQQRPARPRQVDGLGVGQNQQRGGGPQRCRAAGAQLFQGRAQVGAPPVEAGGAHIVPESVHILQRKGVHGMDLL